MTDVQTNGEALKKHSAERINGESPHPATVEFTSETTFKMSQPLNTVTNGPSGDMDSKNNYEPVKEPTQSGNEVFPQPIYTPQQVDGSPRPPLLRIDSRSALSPRPGFPNPLLRPQQPRPPPPGGTPFIQRPPPPPLQRPLGPGQNFFPQGQPPFRPSGPPPPNGAQVNIPRQPINLGGANVGIRPGVPFQRPQVPVRPPGIFQQRSVPTPGPPRAPFNSYPTTPRSQTLDSSDLNQNADGAELAPSAEKIDPEKPALAAMKNRSFSVTGEPKPTSAEDRRRSVSSVGSVDEERRFYPNTSDVVNGKTQNEVPSRPESRAEAHMKRIEEDDDNVFTSNKLPSNKPPSSTNSSNENLTQKFSPNPPSTPSPNLISQQPTSRSSTPAPAVPHQRISTPEGESFQRKSPVRIKEETKEENANIEKPERRTPDSNRASKLRLFKSEGDNDSGVDESTQGNEPLSNGDQASPKKSTKTSTPRSATTPTKNRSFTRGAKSPNPKSPETPTGSTPGTAERKKVPMNKVQVGSAPSPNLKVVKSKIGSLENASHKPGGGHVKIENRKVDFSTASSRIAAKNDTYSPGGGDKKIQQQKLAWNVKSKIGSLENTSHKPKGGEKKIESVKLDFKDKAKSKIGSKDNMKHVPGGGDVKTEPEPEEIKKNNIENRKLEIKVQSKIGSLDNIKHRPGGGDKKIFDDKDYLRQMSANSNPSLDGSQKKKPRPQQLELNSPEVNLISPTQQKVRILEEVQVYEIPSPESRPSSRLSRSGSARSNRPLTPRPPWRY